MQKTTKQEIEALKTEARELLDSIAKLEPEDRRVVLATLRGMVIALEK